MTKNDLERLIAQGLSISNIATFMSVTIGQVLYWKKHYKIKSIRRPGLTKGDKLSEEGKAKRPKLIGELNGFFGKSHSDKTKEKMSKNHADFTGDNNPYKKSLLDPVKKQAARQRSINLWKTRDKEWRKIFAEKQSARSINCYATGRGRNHVNGYHTSNKLTNLNNRLYYRSSWELSLAMMLDAIDDVTSYSYEQERIKFVNTDGCTRFTYSDYVAIIDNSIKLMIEVKPNPISIIKQDRIIAQLSWCISNNIQYIIVDNNLINYELQTIINMAKNGELCARKYDRCRPITPAICAELVGSWKSNQQTD